MPQVCLIEIIGFDDTGEPFARACIDNPPDDKIMVDGVRALKIGDRLLVRLRRIDDSTWRAKIMTRIGERTHDETPTRMVGRVHKRHNGLFFEGIARKKSRHQRDMRIDPRSLATAPEKIDDGDLILSDVAGRNQVRFVEYIGHESEPHAFSLIALAEQEIRIDFPAHVASAAAALGAADASKLDGADMFSHPINRTDLRHLPFVTIDPSDARDHDDAVYAEPDPDPAYPKGAVVWVAIADVATYVRNGEPIDLEAQKRGNSVYLPDRVVPMLPEILSTDLCSLKENVPRFCLAVRMVFDQSGRKRSHQFYRAVMQSTAKLTYSKAQRAFEGDKNAVPMHCAVPLASLWHAYQLLAHARTRRQPLALDIPEQKVLLDEQGQVKRIDVPARLDAHILIEEMMIMANVAAAETLQAHTTALIYRVHPEPERARLRALAEFVKPFGLRYDLGQPPHPRLFNQILTHATEEHRSLMMDAVLRAQAQAVYASKNIGHFGLALNNYAHFTSPIRRYSDLVVHRALIRALALGNDGLDDTDADALDALAETISQCERRAIAAERSAIARYLSAYLAGRIGEIFKVRISGITHSGIFVRLDETSADGFIPMSKIGRERYDVDPQGFTLTARTSKQKYHLGQAIKAELLDANPLTGQLLFGNPRARKPTTSKTQSTQKKGHKAPSPAPLKKKIARR